MNRVLALQQRLLKLPFGRWLFSQSLARYAPYFTTIRPYVEELRPNYHRVRVRKRRAVQNHLGTVHAIAMCNLCEFAGGICMEASIPPHRRWIPVGMTVEYLHKAKTDLVATCDLSNVNWTTTKEVQCDVPVTDTSGTVVMRALIRMKVSDRPGARGAP